MASDVTIRDSVFFRQDYSADNQERMAIFRTVVRFSDCLQGRPRQQIDTRWQCGGRRTDCRCRVELVVLSLPDSRRLYSHSFRRN